MKKLRLAMLISGGGSTMEAIVKACQSGLINMEPALVIASKAAAGGIVKAINLGLPKENILVRSKKELGDFWAETLWHDCQDRGINLIGQYGWLPKTPLILIESYPKMMINQHPGPLDPGRPDFGGKGMFGRAVHCARLLFTREIGRDFWTEVVAQRVAPEFDKGALLKIKRVEIFPSDDVDSLQTRALKAEHEVQIATLQDFANEAVQEIIRTEPLIRSDEIEILERCKAKAIELYPKG